jgi:hypothetical protein
MISERIAWERAYVADIWLAALCHFTAN